MCNLSMQQCNLYCYCNVSANRMQSDESLLSKAMLRCSLTSLLQRYNRHTPKSNFFRRLISHLKSFPHPKIGIEPFIYGHFRAFSTREKNKIGILLFISCWLSKRTKLQYCASPKCYYPTPIYYWPKVYAKLYRTILKARISACTNKKMRLQWFPSSKSPICGSPFGCFPHEQRHYSEMPKAR